MRRLRPVARLLTPTGWLLLFCAVGFAAYASFVLERWNG